MTFLSNPINLLLIAIVFITATFTIDWWLNSSKRKFLKQFKSTNFFLIRWLSQEQKELLHFKKLKFTQTSYEDCESIIVPRSDIWKVLSSLGAEYLAQRPTSISSDTTELFLWFENKQAKSNSNSTQAHQVIVSLDANPRKLAAIHSITSSIFAPVLKKNIEVGLTNITPRNPEFFQIRFEGNKVRKVQHLPRKVFGIDLVREYDIGISSGLGIPVIETKSGIVIAELFENSLNIHLPFWAETTDEIIAAYAMVLLKTIEQLFPEKIVQACFTESIIKELGENGISVNFAEISSNDRERMISKLGDRIDYVLQRLCQIILIPKCNRSIDLYVSSSAVAADNSTQNSTVRIFFDRSYSQSEATTIPSSIFGEPISSNKRFFACSGMGAPLFSEHGQIIAELVNNDLYILFQPIKAVTKAEITLLIKLFLHSSILIEQQNKSSLAQSESFSQAVVQFLAPILETSTNGSERKELARAEAAFDKLNLQTTAAEQAFLNAKFNPQNEFSAEYDRIWKIAQVSDVRVTDTTLEVDTHTLYCVDPRSNRKHEIGKFTISIPLSPERGQIIWRNRTRVINAFREDMHAPHIFAGGKACYGNTENAFINMRRARQYAGIVQLAIAFVESVNVADSAGKQINRWPLA